MMMKRILLVLLVLVLALSACGGSKDAPEGAQNSLVVTDGTSQKSYTAQDLAKLSVSESAFNEVTYKGVSLPVLLTDAGFDAGALKAVKAVASDGYSMNYDPALFQRQDVLVAFATSDGPLAEEDGVFRMVLPGEEGKLNVRMLAELKVMP